MLEERQGRIVVYPLFSPSFTFLRVMKECELTRGLQKLEPPPCVFHFHPALMS